MRLQRFLGLAVFVAAVLPGLPAFGQAWVGNQGELSTSLDYGFATSDKLIIGSDLELDEPIRAHTVSIGAEYNPIDRLGISLSVPIVSTAYKGDGALFPRHGDYDDGDYHTTLQDLSLRARYQIGALEEQLAVAPHIGVSIPMADYEKRGFANAGRHLKAGLVGLSVGRTLDPVLPNLYLHARYELALVEKADGYDYGQNKSDLSAQLGYFLVPTFELNLGYDWHYQHGGFAQDNPTITPDEIRDHDFLLDEDFQMFGGGASFQATDKLSINAGVRIYTTGHDTLNRKTFALGVGWQFL